MRLQSNLGEVRYGGRGDRDNSGKIVAGTVTRVYDKNGTADILLQSGSFIGDNQTTDGIVNAPVQLEGYSGYDEDTGFFYGDYTPLQVGQRVLVAFIGSEKYKPVILGSLPTWNKNKTNVNPREDAYGEYVQARGERIRVNRDQSYEYRNGNGEFENVESNGAFTVGKMHLISDHREDGFNFEDLTLKNKENNKTISVNRDTSLIVPFNYLRVTKDDTKDSTGATYNRYYHNAKLGITRFSKDKPNYLFSIGVDEKDDFEVRIQPKTFKRLRRGDEPKVYDRRTLRKSEETIMRKHYAKNPNPEIEVPDIEEFTSLKIQKDGTLTLFRQTEKGLTEIALTDKGLKVNTSEDIEINTEQKISINSNKDISIKTEGGIGIEAKKGININSHSNIHLNAPTATQSTHDKYSDGYVPGIKKIDTKDLRFKDPGETGTHGMENYEW